MAGKSSTPGSLDALHQGMAEDLRALFSSGVEVAMYQREWAH